MHGGAADRSGLIHPGDEVIEVNGIDVLGKTPNDVLEILVSIDTFIFWRGPDSIFLNSKMPKGPSPLNWFRAKVSDRTERTASASEPFSTLLPPSIDTL